MREIKFRGKRVDNSEWVYGDLIHGMGYKKGKMYILPHVTVYPKLCDNLDGWEVIPETVGQFTGLLDIDRVKIFEGDIVDYVCDGTQHGSIVYDNFGCVSIEFGDDEYLQTIDLRLLGTIEVIGNIHDNPELLTENNKL